MIYAITTVLLVSAWMLLVCHLAEIVGGVIGKSSVAKLLAILIPILCGIVTFGFEVLAVCFIPIALLSPTDYFTLFTSIFGVSTLAFTPLMVIAICAWTMGRTSAMSSNT